MIPIAILDTVSFSYGAADARALDEVSLSIREGELLGIIGPTGAGKSTLCSVLSGAVPHHFRGPFFGAATVCGSDTCEVSLTDIAVNVGSVLQDIDAQMVASVVEDELLFGLENFGVPAAEIPRRVADALETVGIADLRERDIATLSGGQKQKVAIAAILALRPRMLVLDEPTAALDPESSRTVFELLQRINREEGITIVVVEQKVALLSQFCERIAVMERGRIVLEGAPGEVFQETELLRRIGVDCPRTQRIANSLAAAGLCPETPCLTVDAAEALIAGIAGAADSTPAAAAATPCVVAATPETPESPALERAAQAPAIVSFERVSFSYPKGSGAVHDLTFSLAPGEIVSLIGQNGAGKTTATKLLNGLLKPSAGCVTVAGLDTRRVRTSQIAAHLSTLFQNPDHQICKNTVLEEIALSLELTGADATAARERARVVAERFGLPSDEAPFSLSRGQRQLVALASVIVGEPSVIVLDEPTSGLDYRECMVVMETVRAAAERGCAVLMVCHDMEVVSDFADRVIVMAAGRILDEGPTHELFADEALMRRASVEAPQVAELARRLARSVSPAFAGLHEVADVVSCVRKLVQHD